MEGKPTDPKKGAAGPDTGSEHVSTIEILHQHTLGPTRKEKIVLPFVLIIIGAIVAGVLYIAWDHKSKDYRVASAPADVLALAQRPLAAPTGLQGILNPPDDQYVSLPVRSWQYWAGKGAITGDHYLHAPDLKAESMEALVKGDRGAATVTFRLDLSKSKVPDFNVVEIVRGGVVIPEDLENLQIFPLRIQAKPEVNATGADEAYLESHGFAWDRESTFRGVTRFIAIGRLQKGEQGLWIQAKTYNVALSPEMDPGLAEVLLDIANTRKSENVTFFLEMTDLAPAAERSRTKVIGLARVRGVDFGKFFVAAGA